MSKRVLNLLSAAALLLCVETARAFYNPATGHWLSRDPVGEEGGKSPSAKQSVENIPAL